MDRYIDLHTHTTASDGSFSPLELLKHAKERGLSVIAITDHDSLEGVLSLTHNKTDIIDELKIVSGIELSVGFDKEIHILGYFIDNNCDELRTKLSELKMSRKNRIKKVVENVNNLGLSLNFEDIEKISSSENYGRVHVACAMLKKGYITSVKEAFDKYIGAGKPAYEPQQRLKTPKDAINLIRKAGGVPVLAHPIYIERQGINPESLIKELKEFGIMGVECYYPAHDEVKTKYFLEIAEKYNLLKTGGSDFHGEYKTDIDLGNLKVPYSVYEKLGECL